MLGDDIDFQGLIRSKKFETIRGNFDSDGRFYIKIPIDQDLVPPGFRAKKFNEIYSIATGIRSKSLGKNDGNSWAKKFNDRYSTDTGIRSKSSSKTDGNSWAKKFSLGKTNGNVCPNLDSRFVNGNGFSSSEIAEMVSAIKVLKEGFMKNEKG
ncbi:unnamed protein product [Camellia sinensis]